MPPSNPEATDADLRLNVRIGNRLQRIGRMLEKELAKAGATKNQAQFSLLIWGPGRMQYISNAEREDVREAMREMVAKWDRDGADLGKPELPLGGMHDPGD